MIRNLVVAAMIFCAAGVSRSATVDCMDANGPLSINGSLQDCEDARRARAEKIEKERVKASRAAAQEQDDYAIQHPDPSPDMTSLSRFSRFPLANRQSVYARIALITDRDYVGMSPEDHASLSCLKIAEKIDTQRLYEKIGSHGVYNMDSLMAAGPKSCRQFLEMMAHAPL